MKPLFDESGLATEPGDIRCFYYDPDTGEYAGWSDEYINIGVSMPGHSTDKDPGDKAVGGVSVFTGGAWKTEEDHRGETAYSTIDSTPTTVDYIGPIRAEYTSVPPPGLYQKWDGEKWVADTDAQKAANVATANQKKVQLLTRAQAEISLWQTELQLGIISDEDKKSLIAWMQYIKSLQAVDTSNAPDIDWPQPPL